MRVLAFDTATPATAVALWDPEAGLDLEARDDPPPGARPGHAHTLLPLIEDVLRRSGGGWAAVDRLAVGVGPGTFTGLRIGIATAHALARARGLEVVGVGTLAALAVGAWEGETRDAGPQAGILTLLDARRGEAFAAFWAPGADPTSEPPGIEPRVARPEELPELVAPGVLAVGDGAVKFEAVVARAGATVPPPDSPLHRVSARGHCRVASGLAPGEPDAVLPAYLRVPDAEIVRRR